MILQRLNISLLLFYLTLNLFPVFSYSNTIIVSKNGPVRTITEAINLANNFDIILIKPGEYSEGNIIVDKK